MGLFFLCCDFHDHRLVGRWLNRLIRNQPIVYSHPDFVSDPKGIINTIVLTVQLDLGLQEIFVFRIQPKPKVIFVVHAGIYCEDGREIPWWYGTRGSETRKLFAALTRRFVCHAPEQRRPEDIGKVRGCCRFSRWRLVRVLDVTSMPFFWRAHLPRVC